MNWQKGSKELQQNVDESQKVTIFLHFFWQSDPHFPLVAPPNHLLLDDEAWLLFQKQMDLEVQFHAEQRHLRVPPKYNKIQLNTM